MARDWNYSDDENPVVPFRRNAQGTVDCTKLRGNVYSYDRIDLTKFNMVFSPRFSFCLENLCIYEYVETSTAEADGDNVVLPAGGVGRWLKYVCLGATVPVSKEYVDAAIAELLRQFNEEMGNIAFTQVQSDWNETNPENPAFIKNKPEIPEIPNGIVIDQNYKRTDNNFTNEAAQKLSNIEENAQVNKIEVISINGSILPIINKQVNIISPDGNIPLGGAPFDTLIKDADNNPKWLKGLIEIMPENSEINIKEYACKIIIDYKHESDAVIWIGNIFADLQACEIIVFNNKTTELKVYMQNDDIQIDRVDGFEFLPIEAMTAKNILLIPYRIGSQIKVKGVIC